MSSDCTCGWIHTRQTGETFKEPLRVQYDRDCPLHGVIDEEYVWPAEPPKAGPTHVVPEPFDRMWLNKPTRDEEQKEQKEQAMTSDTAQRHRDLMVALVGPHRGVAMNSAEFNAAVHMLASQLITVVDLMAAGATSVTADREAAIRELANLPRPLYDARGEDQQS